MAKALLGHIGGFDLRTEAELRRLRVRVRELEAEVMRLKALNEELSGALSVRDELISISVSEPEPALT
ncbi:MAG TPA: hypothetical protein VKP64_01430 [Mycobacteriales bacterium]|nr:hypothetical protein [Mycobacteriales bacterium]